MRRASLHEGRGDDATRHNPANQQTSKPANQQPSKPANIMKTISELRKAIKPLGFTVKIRSLSWGPHATYIRISDKAELTSNVFTPESLAGWKPILDFRRDNRAALQALRESTGTYGLV